MLAVWRGENGGGRWAQGGRISYLQGPQSLLELQAELGDLPPTVTAETPSGGWHLYFRTDKQVCVPCSVGKHGSGIDVRANGGLVVAPPSFLRDEPRLYAWRAGCSPNDLSIAFLPDCWLARLQEGGRDRASRAGAAVAVGTEAPIVGERAQSSRWGVKAIEGEAAKVAAAPVGQRNEVLNRCAFVLGGLIPSGHVARADVVSALTKAAIAAGLESDEIAATIESGMLAGVQMPRIAPPLQAGCGHAALTVATATAVGRSWPKIMQLRPISPGFELFDPQYRFRSGLLLPTIATVDAVLLEQIVRGASGLGSVNGFRLLQWLVTTAYQAFCAGVREYCRIDVQGGWSGLAIQIGAGAAAATEVRSMVLALAHLLFDFGHNLRGNLLSYVEPIHAARGRPPIVSLTLNAPLLPGFFDKFPPPNTLSARQRADRWQVPILSSLPRLDALHPAYQAPAVRLHWLLLIEFTRRATELAACGCVLLDAEAWAALMTQAELPSAFKGPILELWQDDTHPTIRRFLVRDGDRWTLGTEHAAAVAFIVSGVLRRQQLNREHPARQALRGCAAKPL